MDEEKEKLAAEELAFVQDQFKDEDRRRSVIEGKIGQLLSQVSIVVSLVSLFIPLISNQIGDFPGWLKLLFVAFFLLVITLFTISIWIASHTWGIHRYGYERPDLEDLNHPQKRLEFLERYKLKLKEATTQHIEINNQKGTNLIHAAQAFRLGIIGLGLLIFLLAIVLAFSKPKQQKILLKDPIGVIILDTIKSNPEVILKDTSNK